MRVWICSAEIRTRSFGSVMELTLSAEFEARAHGTDMNMRAGGFPGDGLAEGEVGDVLADEVLEEPAAFGLIWVDGDIDASAVVEAERTVQGGVAHGADRQRLAELALKREFDAGERAHGEDAVAIVAVSQIARVPWILGERAFDEFLGARHQGQCAGEFGARLGKILFLARGIEFLQERREGNERGHAAIHQFASGLERLLAPGQEG